MIIKFPIKSTELTIYMWRVVLEGVAKQVANGEFDKLLPSSDLTAPCGEFVRSELVKCRVDQ